MNYQFYFSPFSTHTNLSHHQVSYRYTSSYISSAMYGDLHIDEMIRSRYWPSAIEL